MKEEKFFWLCVCGPKMEKNVGNSFLNLITSFLPSQVQKPPFVCLIDNFCVLHECEEKFLHHYREKTFVCCEESFPQMRKQIEKYFPARGNLAQTFQDQISLSSHMEIALFFSQMENVKLQKKSLRVWERDKDWGWEVKKVHITFKSHVKVFFSPKRRLFSSFFAISWWEWEMKRDPLTLLYLMPRLF